MSLNFPTVKDQLFRNDQDDWTNNAVLNYFAGKFPAYADGYKAGAQALIRQCTLEDGINDILIYPIVFLYRQFIELRLKDIIKSLFFCNGKQTGLHKTHKIDLLWDQFKTEYQALGESIDDEVFSNAERLILEFVNVDPISMAFRYPIDNEGNQSLSLDHINIRNFGEVMDRLANFLDALSDQISHYSDLASDMYRDLSDEYWR